MVGRTTRGGGHRTGDEPVSNDSKEPRASRLSTRSQLLEQQRRWAVSTGQTVDSRGYVTELEDNLFQPLSARAASAFAAGGGSELLSRSAAPPKMQALHSSAALAVTFRHFRRDGTYDPNSLYLRPPTVGSNLE